MFFSSFAILLCLDLLLLGCGYSENGTVHGLPMQSQKIKHIVVIMQENRSFDNLFHGFPGADTVDSGMSDGKLRDWAARGWLHARRSSAHGLWIVWADDRERRRLLRLKARSRRGWEHLREL